MNKELSIEEKAKAYDSIIEKANKMHSENCDACKVCIEELIPELAESEDERIRKALINVFATHKDYEMFFGVSVEDIRAWLEKQAERKTPQWMIDFLDGYRRKIGCCLDHDEARDVEGKILCIMQWLENQDEQEKDILEDAILDGNEDGLIAETIRYKNEKQGEQKIEMKTAEESLGISSDEYNKIVDECIFGEQKPSTQLKPKFKVGDWLIFNESHNSVYQVERIDNYHYYLRHYLGSTMSAHFDNELIRLWTLQDAKSGDVLADNDGVILFRKIGNERYADVVDYYCVVNTSGRFEIQERFDYWGEANDAQLHPATKEQRELLFQKMKEAGYTFDFEKKELKKNEQKTKENNGNIGGISSNWSEDDEAIE